MNLSESAKKLFLSFLHEENASCPVCARLMIFEKGELCSKCEEKLTKSRKDVCSRCGRDLPRGEHGICSKCRLSNSLLLQCVSLYNYDVFAKMVVHAIKYDFNIALGKKTGELLGRRLRALSFHNMIDIIIPVPLHSERLKERGFNQSDVLSEAISKELNIGCNATALQRKRPTEDQTHLSAALRRKNVSGAFEVEDKNIIKNKTVLLVDDVLTTGATMEECAKTLIGSGAKVVLGASIASTDYDKKEKR